MKENKLLEISNTNKDLINYAIHKNLEAIFGFSMKRTSNRQDAEDLTQDIITEVYRSCFKLKSYDGPEALEGWIWAIARHTYCRWINKRKKNNVVYIEGPFIDESIKSTDDLIADKVIKEEQLNNLRKELSLLSKNYRDIIVLYYIEDKSCNEISEIEKIPLTTVKWRLHEAKRIVRERMENMKLYTEKTYAPGTFWLSSTGTFSSPHSCTYVYDLVKTLLRQNILLSAYRKPQTIEEISLDLGVPRVYIEEDLDCLVEEQLINKTPSLKYQTNFVIITKDIKDKIYSIIEEGSCKIAEEILCEVNKLEGSIREIGFLGSDKPWKELLLLLIPSYVDSYFDYKNIKIDTPLRPHGNTWKLLGFEGAKSDYPWSGSSNCNVFFDGAFKQYTFWTNVLTLRAGQLTKDEAKFYYDFLKGDINFNNLDKNSEEIAAQLISRGFIKNIKGKIEPAMISLREDEFTALKRIIKASLDNFKSTVIEENGSRILTELKKSVPMELRDEVPAVTDMLSMDIVGYIMKFLFEKNIIHLKKPLETSVEGMFAIYKQDS